VRPAPKPSLTVTLHNSRLLNSIAPLNSKFNDLQGGKAPLKPDLPKRLTPLPDLFPTHVIHLDAPEPTLLSRCLALGEHELAAARAAAAAAAAAEGKPAAAPAKGKAKEPAGPMTHNTDKDFK